MQLAAQLAHFVFRFVPTGEFAGRGECGDPAVAVRSGLNKLFIFFKLREARSLLYRRRFLQVNIRWKALDEIYKMYIPLHRSDIKIPAKSRHNFGKHELIQNSIHSNFRKFDMNIAIYLLNFDDIVSEFHGSVQK